MLLGCDQLVPAIFWLAVANYGRLWVDCWGQVSASDPKLEYLKHLSVSCQPEPAWAYNHGAQIVLGVAQ